MGSVWPRTCRSRSAPGFDAKCGLLSLSPFVHVPGGRLFLILFATSSVASCAPEVRGARCGGQRCWKILGDRGGLDGTARVPRLGVVVFRSRVDTGRLGSRPDRRSDHQGGLDRPAPVRLGGRHPGGGGASGRPWRLRSRAFTGIRSLKTTGPLVHGPASVASQLQRATCRCRRRCGWRPAVPTTVKMTVMHADGRGQVFGARHQGEREVTPRLGDDDGRTRSRGQSGSSSHRGGVGDGGVLHRRSTPQSAPPADVRLGTTR
jgi:hypothetical protein